MLTAPQKPSGAVIPYAVSVKCDLSGKVKSFNMICKPGTTLEEARASCEARFGDRLISVA